MTDLKVVAGTVEPHAALQIDRRVLIDLINEGAVDCDRMVQIVQLMGMPEFGAFFDALCQINVADAERAGQVLAHCAVELRRDTIAIHDLVALIIRRHMPEVDGNAR